MKRLKNKLVKLYEDRVINDSRAQTVLLKVLNLWRRNIAKTRAFYRSYTFSKVPNLNIYHAAVQKTGSQWIKTVFDDRRIRRYTGLDTYPGHRYEWDEFHKRFPKYHFVPGLFISYGQYEEIRKPTRYKTFYVIRDPRNIVVSWYFSALETHRLMGKVPKYRRVLIELSFDAGIEYAMKVLAYKFAFMRSWIYNSDDPKVLIIRFEDLVNDPVKNLDKVFRHCDVEIPQKMLSEVVADYIKQGMRERDERRNLLMKRSTSDKSHYRRSSGDWQDVFTQHHIQLFNRINGDLVRLLGYD